MRLWRYCSPPPGLIRGMAAGTIPAAGHLPQQGGVVDQPAWLMDAFDVISAAYVELTRRDES